MEKNLGIVYADEDEVKDYLSGKRILYWGKRKVHNLSRCGNCSRDPRNTI